MKRKAPTSRFRRRVKRKFNRRKKVMRRKVGVVNVKRTLYAGTWTWGTATVNDFWRYVTFDMGSFNNFPDFSAVFDEYKVNAIKVTYRPQYDSIQNITAAGTLTQPQAYAHYIIDPASTLNPAGTYVAATLNGFLENQGVRTRTLNKPFSIYFKPKVVDQVLGTGTAGVMRSSPWVRTSDAGTAYRGYHMFIQQNGFSSGNSNIKLDTFITFYCQFRNLK